MSAEFYRRETDWDPEFTLVQNQAGEFYLDDTADRVLGAVGDAAKLKKVWIVGQKKPDGFEVFSRREGELLKKFSPGGNPLPLAGEAFMQPA